MADLDNTYFLSDPHFNHKKIIQYCNRPFDSVEAMNETLVSNVNSRVRENDILCLIGDLGWPNPIEYIERLNGIKLLIRGNHDKDNVVEELLKKGIIANCVDYFTMDSPSKRYPSIVLMHYPIESWDKKYHGSIHLHGHTHGTLDNSGLLRFDMSVEANNYGPVSLREVIAMADKRFEEIGGLAGIRGELGDKENNGLREVKRVIRDDGMRALYNEAEKDFEGFLKTHAMLKEFYETYSGSLATD